MVAPKATFYEFKTPTKTIPANTIASKTVKPLIGKLPEMIPRIAITNTHVGTRVPPELCLGEEVGPDEELFDEDIL